jgi:colicin import membrane protein
MEKLSEEQRRVISKMNPTALAVKLSRSGVSDDALQHMSREEMLNAWALAVAEGRDKPKEEVFAAAVGYDAEVEKLRLQFEMRRWEEERKEREAERLRQEAIEEEEKREREAERLRQEKIREEGKRERAAERERQERIAEAERERLDKIAEAERKIRQQELDLRRAEIAKQTKWRAVKVEWQHQLEDARKQREAEPVYKAKLFGDALRGTVAKMPSDALELIP